MTLLGNKRTKLYRVVGGRGHGFAVAAGLPAPSHRHKERGGFKGIRRKGKMVMGVVPRSL